MAETETGHESADIAAIAAGATDSGSGAETAGAVAQVAISDIGMGTDTGDADITKPVSDTGSGADSGIVAVAVPTGDTGNGTEATRTGIDTAEGGTAAAELTGMQVPPTSDILVYVVPTAYRVPS